MNTHNKSSLAGHTKNREAGRKAKPAGRRWIAFIAAAAAVLSVLGAVLWISKTAGMKGTEERNDAFAGLPEGFEFMADTSVPKGANLPKSQKGEYIGKAEYSRDYTFYEAYQAAEAACILTVKNWLGETDAGTYYEAELGKLYKGELPATFTLFQCSNSEVVMEGSPLFTYGDKLLVFLVPWSEEGYENSYDILGADIAMFYAAASEDGGVYLIDHKGVFSNVNKERDPDTQLTDHVGDEALPNELFDYIGSFDKAMADQLRSYCEATTEHGESVSLPMHIYSLEEIEAVFEREG